MAFFGQDPLITYALCVCEAIREWCLVRVAFNDFISLHPSALQDGRFLVEFYVLHPADARFNATNQQYWLQYCTRNGISNSDLDAHLITPSYTSEERTTHRHLLPIHYWVNLTHADTFIHGPFDFSTVNGRKTWDPVGQKGLGYVDGTVLDVQ